VADKTFSTKTAILHSKRPILLGRDGRLDQRGMGASPNLCMAVEVFGVSAPDLKSDGRVPQRALSPYPTVRFQDGCGEKAMFCHAFAASV